MFNRKLSFHSEKNVNLQIYLIFCTFQSQQQQKYFHRSLNKSFKFDDWFELTRCQLFSNGDRNTLKANLALRHFLQTIFCRDLKHYNFINFSSPSTIAINDFDLIVHKKELNFM